MSWWIQICDVPLDGDYRISIIKGLFTIMIFTLIGFALGRISKRDAKESRGEKK